jgi:cysteinyl-tRNA synthetase
VTTPSLSIYNTRTRAIERFEPREPPAVGLYTCGPTVYSFAHLGNLRTYVFEDLVRRGLELFGYQVRHVMNVTDVGHLQSDADEGEDKLQLAAAREQRSPWDIARDYERVFFEHCKALNVLPPTLVCRATDHIAEMIDFTRGLVDAGFGYVVDGNVYFDTSKFPSYREFARLTDDVETQVNRVEADARKRNQRDFVLWFSQSKYPNQIMKWDSPWGQGFPGWHIECSAMASKYLGERFDIHCGGIDHVSVHHTNEIAQSEARFGHRWVDLWMHGEFLVVDNEKISKSAGTALTVDWLVERGFTALDYRYMLLTAHYRTKLSFHEDGLRSARQSRASLIRKVVELRQRAGQGGAAADGDPAAEAYRQQFRTAIGNDFNLPEALAVVWGAIKDEALAPAQRLALMTDFDRILGLDLATAQLVLTDHQRALVAEREQARKDKNWPRADELRKALAQEGLEVKDSPAGPVVLPKTGPSP